MPDRPRCTAGTHLHSMDEPTDPTSGGRTPAADQASSWRPATIIGASSGFLVPGHGADRRSAAFVAHVVGALERTQRRWF